METVETQLPSSVSSPQLARAFLRSTLETWKLDGFGDVTELLVTELVANVVTHVGAPMTLRVQRTPSIMRVEIEDPSSEVPVVRHPDVAEERARRSCRRVRALDDDPAVELSADDARDETRGGQRQGRLAGARPTRHADALAAFDREVDPLEAVLAPSRISNAEALDQERGRQRRPPGIRLR